ncbi:putative DsbA family dithiol-disulfide isomerase [Metabacillus crassostreae]|uniref:DsbA family protein n=1 Tax=Metabacillus crassostreae TaxID=929098 RepID=UPI00195F0403|nr:putative DsbA family dithiol-disulfide isomerase [Metabacillus crassostreae]
MTLKIKVYSDYVCPFCLIAKKPFDEAIKGKDVEAEWMPYELRPYPNETLKPEETYLQSIWKQSVYPMAKEMGMSMVLPKISPQPYTHLAFEGYQYAKENGKAIEYNERILSAFFQEEQNIGEIEVLTKLAIELGLNGEEFNKALKTRKYKEKHQQELKKAINEVNIQAVPTFIIGNQMVAGVRSKEEFEEIINQELKPTSLQFFGEGMSCGIDGC